ncbi:hypothetical protein [Silvibacterium sp.]|uniref:hypothetical protein n=1 Tax=Silvibacterium sp. TaxID=1964179 RepID=UPI0039E31781
MQSKRNSLAAALGMARLDPSPGPDFRSGRFFLDFLGLLSREAGEIFPKIPQVAVKGSDKAFSVEEVDIRNVHEI